MNGSAPMNPSESDRKPMVVLCDACDTWPRVWVFIVSGLGNPLRLVSICERCREAGKWEADLAT